MNYVIYHSPCYDGFCAAWAAWRAMGNDAVYVPADPNDPPPELPEDACVVAVDISWSRGDTLRLRESVRDLVILDHHHTAREELSGLQYATFDMDKSGARLAWEFFHPGKQVPWIVRYVEDRDLFRFDLEGTREIQAFLSTFAFEFEQWEDAARMIESFRGTARSIGSAILRYEKVRQREAMNQAHLVLVQDIGREIIAINLNLKQFVTDTLTAMLDEYAVDVVASYYRRPDGRWNWSLRSHEGFDCSAIARKLGGGGHKQAAGFTTAHPPIYLGQESDIEHDRQRT